MNKTIEQLRQEYEKGALMLEQYQHKMAQLENRINYYEKGDRKRRAHRLITRGAAIESLLPETKHLTEREFYLLMERISFIPQVLEIVRTTVSGGEQ